MLRAENAPLIRLADYRAPDFTTRQVRLTFQLDPQATLVEAVSQIERVAGQGTPLELSFKTSELLDIAVNGQLLGPDQIVREGETISLPGVPDRFELTVRTRLNPAANTALEGLYVSGGRFCSQCEPEGFRTITPFQDRPDVMARWQVRIEADKVAYPHLLSNGDPVESGDLPGGRHFAQWNDPHPKPSYLFALCAGQYDVLRDSFTTVSGRKVQLGIYVDEGQAPRAAYAMDSLKRSMAWDETAFGREYDLDVFNIVAVRDFNFGAMENKGLNVFNAAYVLADQTSATDLDYEAIESIVGHEYFHNWTGNRITLRDWFQLCLKEGFTVFRDQEFSADQRSRGVQRVKDIKRLRARQFPEDAGPLAHPVRPPVYAKIDNFYTATVYEKGAELVRVLHTLLGPEKFRAACDLYFARCDGTSATVEDFLACFEEIAGRPLPAFRRWYAQPGTPTLSVTTHWDEAAGKVRLNLSQSNGKHAPVMIPVVLGFLDGKGAPLALQREGDEQPRADHLVVLVDERASVVFSGAHTRPILSVLRGFSAPVLLDHDLPRADELLLLAHDSDRATRWDMAQKLSAGMIRHTAAALRNGALPPDLTPLANALAQAVTSLHAQDPAFAALMLRLPTLGDLMAGMLDMDMDSFVAARIALQQALARAGQGLWEGLVDAPAGSFDPSAASAGPRALKVAAMDVLASLGTGQEARLKGAFDRATTMTEQLGALEALGAAGAPGAQVADQPSKAFDEALAAFLAQHHANPLVVDKWVSAQAAAPRADVLARVQALHAGPHFDLRNPNRVRALVMAFAQRNLGAFHAKDGSGYAFLADAILQVDPLNPALAARMAGAFESWGQMEPVRRGHARAQLTRLQEAGGASANLMEIVGNLLKA